MEWLRTCSSTPAIKVDLEVVLLDTHILQQGHHQVDKMFESAKESLPNGEKK